MALAAVARRRRLLDDNVIVPLADGSWEILDISGSNVTDVGLIKLAGICRSLRAVDIRYVSYISYISGLMGLTLNCFISLRVPQHIPERGWKILSLCYTWVSSRLGHVLNSIFLTSFFLFR